MSADRIRKKVGPVAEPTEEEIRRARLAVAAHSADAAECKETLEMLGLKEPDFEWKVIASHTGQQGRKKILKETA